MYSAKIVYPQTMPRFLTSWLGLKQSIPDYASLSNFLARVETVRPQTVPRFLISWLGLKQSIPRL
ncbi:hypothetical protein [Streptococcus suis]|uniref:hypothetical protein n=1 Tax=Streptococcus suis TaxID=1307 RepID=UPI0012902D4F|nr:hypothetical protein [Streptococcus suis]